MAMQNELAKADLNKKVVSAKEMIASYKDLIASALPQNVAYERLERLTVAALRKQPELLTCTKESLIGALIECAGWGLQPFGGLVYLVPRRNKGVNEVAFQLGYRGIVELIMRSGKVAYVNAHCFYDNEKFEVSYGTNPQILHVPLDTKERGEIAGAYAVFKLHTGDTQFNVLWKDEIEKRRRVAKTDFIWKQWTEEMYKKTAVHNGAKFLQLSAEIHETLQKDATVVNVNPEREKVKAELIGTPAEDEFYDEDLSLEHPEVDDESIER